MAIMAVIRVTGLTYHSMRNSYDFGVDRVAYKVAASWNRFRQSKSAENLLKILPHLGSQCFKLRVAGPDNIFQLINI
jgi:hypothetical protein